MLWACDVVIRPTYMIDTKQLRMIKDQELCLIHGRISKIGKRHEFTSRKIITLENQYLLPAFIDMHTHLFLEARHPSIGFAQDLIAISQLKEETRIAKAKERAREYARAGFLTLRDLGQAGNHLEHHVTFPRIIYSGNGVAQFPGQFPLKALKSDVSKEHILYNNPSELKTQIQSLKNHGATWLKVYLDNDPSPGELNRDQLSHILQLAKEFKLPIAAHAIATSMKFTDSQLKQIATFEHAFPLLQHPLLPQLKEKVVLTEYPGHLFCPSNFTETLASQMRIRSLKKNNIPFMFGSDLYFPFCQDNERDSQVQKQLDYLHQQGISLQELLQALTFRAGEKLNLPIGQIKQGFSADFIAVSVNPLTRPYWRKIKWKMFAGQVLDESSDAKTVKPVHKL